MSNPLWEGLDTAEVYESGSYFDPGVYRVEIKRCLSKTSRKPGGSPVFIVETEVLESNNPKHVVGSSGSWVQSFKDPKMAQSEIKKFLVALFGGASNDPAFMMRINATIKQAMMRIEGPENALAGAIVTLETWHKKTKKDTDFTVYDWGQLESGITWDQFLAGHSAASGGSGGVPAPVAPVAPSPAVLPVAFVLPVGAQPSPDGRHFYDPANPAAMWQPMPPPVASAPPPPPPPPAFVLPPGASTSPDGRHYYDPANPAAMWQPIPRAR